MSGYFGFEQRGFFLMPQLLSREQITQRTNVVSAILRELNLLKEDESLLTFDDGAIQALIIPTSEEPLLDDETLRESIRFQEISNDVDNTRSIMCSGDMESRCRQLRDKTWRFISVSVPCYPDGSKQEMLKQKIRAQYGLCDDRYFWRELSDDRTNSLVFVVVKNNPEETS